MKYLGQFDRRTFLKLATQSILWVSGVLGMGGILRFLSYEPDPPPPVEYDIGLVENYPLNSKTVLPNIPAVLVRTPEGFHALSLVCTHLSCTVESSLGTYSCPCHGSRYDAQGNVTRGPAGTPLRTLKVELEPDGTLVVYKS